MSRYAAQTTVSSEKSRAEIEMTLMRYGATGFMYGWADANAVVMFQMAERRVKFLLPLPDREGFKKTPAGRRDRNVDAQMGAFDQAVRQRWRALLLVIKAKLEAVESGITEFEDEFMAHIVMPDGRTVSEHVRPKITTAYKTGKMPPLLPDLRAEKQAP